MTKRRTAFLFQMTAILFGVAVYPVGASAQAVFKMEHLTPKDGLSYRWALDIAQDSLGYIWIATFDGLNRYDGHRFTTYLPEGKSRPGFILNRLKQVDCLPGNKILIASESGALMQFDLETGQLKPVKVEPDKDVPLNARLLFMVNGTHNWALLQTETGREWLGRTVSTGQFDTLFLLYDHTVIGKHLIPLNGGSRFWGRSEDAYFLFDPDAHSQEWHPFAAIPGASIAHPHLPVDRQGRFWFPGTDGVFRSLNLPRSIPVGQWQKFHLDNKGNFWFWTQDKRMYRYVVAADTLEFIGIADFWEYTLDSPFEDREGNIWIPHFYGVTKLVRERRLFENYLNRPVNELGASSGGKSVYFIGEKDDGTVYIEADREGFVRLRPGSTMPEHAPDVPVTVTPADEALLLQSVEKAGLDRSKLIRKTTWFHDNGRGVFWVCPQQSQRVYRMDTRNRSWQSFEISKSPVSVWCLLPLNDHLWIGTDNGLYRLNPADGQCQRFTTKEGLAHNIIYTMLPDGDRLWLGTHHGLCRFDTRDGKVQTYYVEDGLTHNEFNRRSALKTRDGKFYFGGLNGFNAFYPADIERAMPRFQPNLYLTRFTKLDGRHDTLLTSIYFVADPIDAIRLNASDRSFVFEFSINSFFNPAQNKYLYYLDGLEPPWSNETNAGRVAYSYIPPGSYVLRVKAAGPFGNPAANEIALPIVMPRVWYLRWWAWLGYILMALGAGILLYRIRLRQHLEHREALRLQELDEVKTKLYTNITHEFRTPLTVILGMTEQLAGEQKADTARGKLDIIQRNGENLLHLVNQLLDLAKLESGKLSLHLVQADIIQYLRYVAGSFHSFAAHKNIELHFLPHTEQFPMDFDKERMLHILSNLLSNAVKFTGTRGHIYLQTARDGDRFLIKVKDTGSGIPADKLPHIFDRFYQVDDSRTRQGEGTGIGLTLVHELVQLMSGVISVQSQPGKGSEFTVSLPVTHNAPLAGDQPDISPLRGHVLLQQTPQKFAEATNSSDLPLLLTVEDNADVAEYIRSCLDGQFRIIHAANGDEGIEKAMEEIPDLVVSDVMMPVKDGFELVQTLKQDARTNHIPIVLLTAKADITSKLEGLERGADAYLPKPFHPKELQLLLRNLLDRQRRLQEKYAGQDFSVAAADEPTVDAADPQNAFLEEATRIILAHLDDAAFGNDELAREMTMSESQLNRKIKALTGQTLSLFIRSARLREGRKLLTGTTLTVSEIAYAVGFADPAYFSRTFSAEFGKAPTAFRN